MEPQGRGNVPALHTPERNKQLGLRKTTLESRGHVQTVGLNAETTTCRHRAEGGECLLTFPFIGLSEWGSHPEGWPETAFREMTDETCGRVVARPNIIAVLDLPGRHFAAGRLSLNSTAMLKMPP